VRHPEDEPAQAEVEFCERCGDPMPEGCIGECSVCREQAPPERDPVASGGMCICWPGDFNGRSVCGVPCPVHQEAKREREGKALAPESKAK